MSLNIYCREKLTLSKFVGKVNFSERKFEENCSVQKIKGFYQSSLEKEIDFRDIMNISLNILAKN